MAGSESLPGAAALPPAWHTLPLDDVVQRLATDSLRGLSAEEAVRRLVADGPNTLQEPTTVPWWRTFLAQFLSLIHI